MKPVAVKDIGRSGSAEEELSAESIVKKLAFVVVAFYCLSTEQRFEEEKYHHSAISANLHHSKISDSEYFLGKSLEIAYKFLPHRAPIINQIISIHSKFHGVEKQIIPE
jgi:hypothetical protein